MKRSLLILLALATWTISQSWEGGINFRNYGPHATDSTHETYSLGGAYPETRNSLTFGFTQDRTAGSQDLSWPYDHRLLGCMFRINSGNPVDTFKFNVPSAGNYRVKLASGSNNFSGVNNYIKLCDSSTSVLYTYSTACDTTQCMDATGVVRLASNWPTTNAYQAVTLAHTQFWVIMGNTAGSGITLLNHIYLYKDDAGATPKCTVVVVAGTGGTVNNAGPFSGDTGSTYTDTATANTCYQFDSVSNTQAKLTFVSKTNRFFQFTTHSNGRDTIHANFSSIQSILIRKSTNIYRGH
jgi:hypothetical protein